MGVTAPLRPAANQQQVTALATEPMPGTGPAAAADRMGGVVRSMTGSPFVARSAQLEVFQLALARTRAGEPGALVLSGDAGVGKTRLVTRVAEIASADGFLVLTGHCMDFGDVGLPYLPFTEAIGQLRSLTGGVDEAITVRPVLGRLLDGGDEAAVGADEQTARAQLFDGLARALGTAGTAEHPLLLIIEDLHWADPSSRDVLRFMLARFRTEHLLVVLTYRADDLHRRHPLRPLLAELVRHPRVDHLSLPPFTRDELAEFGAAVTGAPVTDAVLQRVLDRSEGNAFFALELLECGPDSDLLPGSLADVVHARLERLPPAVAELAGMASVAGRRVSAGLLAAVATHRAAFADPADFDAILREAVTQHILEVPQQDGADPVIAFRHALLAEVVYADLLPGELVALHRIYAAELAANPAFSDGPAELAHHALRSNDLPTALAASHTAAERAREVLAPAEELRHLETVLRLWDTVPDAARLAGRDRVAVTMAAAAAAGRAGQPGRAVAVANSALTMADPIRAAELTAATATYLIDNEQAERAEEAAAGALTVLDAEPPSPGRARLLAAHARSALNNDHDEEARVSASRAIMEARGLGVPDAEADALATLAVLEVDDPDRAAELLVAALGRATATGDVLAELRSRHNLVAGRYYAGALADATRLCDQGIDRARSTGVLWMGYGVGLLIFRELLRYLTGDLTPAQPATDWVPESAIWTLSVVGLYAAAARGDPDVVDRGRAVEAEWTRDPMMALVSGGCTIDALTWAGEYQAAIDLADQLVSHLERAWNDYFLGGIWLSTLALAALADRAEQTRLTGGDPAADVAAGVVLLDRTVSTAMRGRPRGGRLGPEGLAWLARAHAEYGRLTGRDDPGRWREVVDLFGYGHRYEQARSGWRLAAALLAGGDREAATVAAGVALDAASGMGAGPLTAAIIALSRRGRLDLPGTRSAVAVLTAREQEVLQLVAQGLTNRQVGERMFISGKTVSVHMSNVLTKLGAAGRAEAVSIAHRRGLLNDPAAR